MLQSAARRARILALASDLLLSARMLSNGNVFVKFSQNGPPHDRWVWLEEHQSLQWADPVKKQNGQLKGLEATIMLKDITAISEGIKSELGKHQKTSMFQKMRGFKAATSGISKLDQDCCLNILSHQRSLDLQAANRMIRKDWLLALRLLLTFRGLDLGLVGDRAKLREFVKPKGRPKRPSGAAAVGKAFTNFFSARTRAESAAIKSQELATGGSARGGGGAGAAALLKAAPAINEAEDEDGGGGASDGAAEDEVSELAPSSPMKRGLGLNRAVSGEL